jgi:hypothetical protein
VALTLCALLLGAAIALPYAKQMSQRFTGSADAPARNERAARTIEHADGRGARAPSPNKCAVQPLAQRDRWWRRLEHQWNSQNRWNSRRSSK